jgi:hypothetical protein
MSEGLKALYRYKTSIEEDLKESLKTNGANSKEHKELKGSIQGTLNCVNHKIACIEGK